ncbi:MAG: TonB-dependent receptor, partial [Pseudomonadota bacterium]
LGEILSDQPSSVPLTPFGTVFTGVTPGGEPIFRTENFDGLTWRAAATYEINDQINAFLTYARGRTPEIIAVSSFDFSPEDFDILDDEKVDAVEGGVKGVFLDGALFADLSVYYYDYRDFQTSQIVNGQIIALNAGDARSIGVETSFNWQITDTVSAGGNYGFNDFEFTTGAFDGNRPRLSPEHAISLYGEVTHSLAETGAELFLRPSFTWQSEVFFDNDNDRSDLQSVETGRLPGFEDTIVDELQESYALLNLRGGVTFQNFTLEAFATNLLDKEYIIDAGNTGDGFGIPTFIRGEPRLYGVNLRAEF